MLFCSVEVGFLYKVTGGILYWVFKYLPYLWWESKNLPVDVSEAEDVSERQQAQLCGSGCPAQSWKYAECLNCKVNMRSMWLIRKKVDILRKHGIADTVVRFTRSTCLKWLVWKSWLCWILFCQTLYVTSGKSTFYFLSFCLWTTMVFTEGLIIAYTAC